MFCLLVTWCTQYFSSFKYPSLLKSVKLMIIRMNTILFDIVEHSYHQLIILVELYLVFTSSRVTELPLEKLLAGILQKGSQYLYVREKKKGFIWRFYCVVHMNTDTAIALLPGSCSCSCSCPTSDSQEKCSSFAYER